MVTDRDHWPMVSYNSTFSSCNKGRLPVIFVFRIVRWSWHFLARCVIFCCCAVLTFTLNSKQFVVFFSWYFNKNWYRTISGRLLYFFRAILIDYQLIKGVSVAANISAPPLDKSNKNKNKKRIQRNIWAHLWKKANKSKIYIY